MKLLDYESFPDFAKDIPEKMPERVPVRWDEQRNAIEWEDRYPQDGVEVSALLSLLLAVSMNLTARVEALEQVA
jgi:hypothetical protein